jgi:hypothetical protein
MARDFFIIFRNIISVQEINILNLLLDFEILFPSLVTARLEELFYICNLYKLEFIIWN